MAGWDTMDVNSKAMMAKEMLVTVSGIEIPAKRIC
jgi:hypothetical protein